jgi:uncharacterized protein (TIGR02598 family)
MKSFIASKHRRLLACVRGFSLPEVTIAVGITALGIVAILGLLPQGYDMAMKTSQLTAESRIVQTITGEFNTGDWSRIEDGVRGNRWFDDQGLEVRSRNDTAISYVALVEVPAPDMRLPGNNSNAQPEDALRRIIIKIAASPNPDYSFTNPKRFSTISALIAKTN